MRNGLTRTGILLLALRAAVADQDRDANQILAEARKAMGGDKLAAVKTLTASGRARRIESRGRTREYELEIALELPDRYVMRSVMMAMGNMSIYRSSGFNGEQAIDDIDSPPNLAGGATVTVRLRGPDGVDLEKLTPVEKTDLDRQRLLAKKKDFARLALGIFASSLAAYPMEFTYVGQAESADGKAEAIDIKGAGEFAARLFIDARTHLPLMLSWLDKEPLATEEGLGGPTSAGPPAISIVGGGGSGTITVHGGSPLSSSGTVSNEERQKSQKLQEERRREAEARRSTVEYRILYADYQSVGGVWLPHRIQRAIAGKTTEEMTFESFKINPKINAKRFTVTK